MIESNVLSCIDFELNLNFLRNKQREMYRLADFEKVDCVTLSLTPFKGGLEESFQRTIDTLLTILRKKVMDQFNQVDQFMQTVKERCSTPPHGLRYDKMRCNVITLFAEKLERPSIFIKSS